MQSFTVKSSLTIADWRALAMCSGRRMQQAQPGSRTLLLRLAPIALSLVIGAAVCFMLFARPPLVRPSGLAILLAIGLGYSWWVYRLRLKSYEPDEQGVFLGSQLFEFSPASFRVERRNCVVDNRWSVVREITAGDDHLFIWLDRFSGYVLPARDLPAPMTLADAAARLREFVAAAAAAPAEATEMTAPAIDVAAADESLAIAASPADLTPIRPSSAPPTVRQELWAVLRLFAWSYVHPTKLFGRENTLGLLGMVSLLLWVGLDRLNYSGEVLLTPFAGSSVALVLLAALFLAWLLTRLSKPRLELRQGMLLIFGLCPLIAIASWALGSCPRAVVFSVGGVLAFECLRYLHRGLRCMSGRRQWLALVATAVSGLLMLYGAEQSYQVSSLWYESQVDDEQAMEESKQDRQLVFEQSSAIDARLASLSPRIEGQTNAFFVGFAGYGLQRVFVQEIELAAKAIGEKYRAAGHTLLLANSPPEILRHPFASPQALRHALKGLATRMNLEEDVLFLSLSSHGSDDGRISVASNYDYWDDLTATDLASMLNEARIRWKVIVISACYAGSFIDALKDDSTIILTAAAADRTSFGCSDDSELTYFGEAFYQDSLPGADSLRQAFATARASIGTREQTEGLQGSDPQAFFGEQMSAKLAALEHALRVEKRGPAPDR
jgi:hypothetical protein